jgi:aspartate aminotransferase-like enzyme
MRAALERNETPFTPAVALVAGQAEALRLIRAEGIENVWKKTAALAAYTRGWAQSAGLPLLADRPANILTALKLPKGVDGKKLLAELRERDGLSIAGGQGPLKGKLVRVAHMGHIGKADLDAGFEALSRNLKTKAASSQP